MKQDRVMLQVRVSPEFRARVERMAGERGQTILVAVTRALTAELERFESRKRPRYLTESKKKNQT